MPPTLHAVGSEPGAPNPPSRWRRFFLWCSGSDQEKLVEATERTKHAGYGTLVCIPAAAGAISATIALATFMPWAFAVVGGLLWGAIVFAFDRFVVSTMPKSGSLVADLFSVAFLLRLVLAVGFGVVVSHPLVIQIFRDSIETQLDKELQEKRLAVESRFSARAEASLQSLAALHKEEATRREEVSKAWDAYLAEAAGELRLGVTTGIRGEGVVARRRREEAERLERSFDAWKKVADSKVVSLNDEREAFREEQWNELATIQVRRGYTERERALQMLAARDAGVARARSFLIVFFVLIDILPVLFKTLTPRGMYEERIAHAERSEHARLSMQEEAVAAAREDGVEFLFRRNRVEQEAQDRAFALAEVERLMDDVVGHLDERLRRLSRPLRRAQGARERHYRTAMEGLLAASDAVVAAAIGRTRETLTGDDPDRPRPDEADRTPGSGPRRIG